MMKAEIHRILQNPIYTGDFRWLGKPFHGSHEPLISRDTFAAVQAVLNRKPRALSEAAPRVHRSAHVPVVAAR